MEPRIDIDGRVISDSAPCYLIAEIGHNHQGDVEVAMKMIDAAADAGAHAVKFQKRDNRGLYTKALFDQPYDHENSFGKTYGEHREAIELGMAEYVMLKEHARKREVTLFATAFDEASADFLEELGVPAYKIASGDVTNHPLLVHVAKKGKPVIMSTGAATMEEVRAAYRVLTQHNDQICLMQCTAGYPVEDYGQLDLGVIGTYRREFPGAVIGFSSHDGGIVMPVVAYVLGARVVEKHFTLNRAMKGTDHAFSLEPGGLHRVARDLERTRLALMNDEKHFYPSERSARRKMGKSIVTARPVAAGTKISIEDVTFKSPLDGIPPSELDHVLGRAVATDLSEDTIIQWEHLR